MAARHRAAVSSARRSRTGCDAGERQCLSPVSTCVDCPSGDLETARELLEPLLHRRRFHFTEFAAFAQAQIDRLLAEGQREGARHWFEMWESMDPDNPYLERCRNRVRGREWLPWRRMG